MSKGAAVAPQAPPRKAQIIKDRLFLLSQRAVKLPPQAAMLTAFLPLLRTSLERMSDKDLEDVGKLLRYLGGADE